MSRPAGAEKAEDFVRTPMSSVHSGQTGTPKSAVTPRVLDLSSGQRYIQCPVVLTDHALVLLS